MCSDSAHDIGRDLELQKYGLWKQLGKLLETEAEQNYIDYDAFGKSVYQVLDHILQLERFCDEREYDQSDRILPDHKLTLSPEQRGRLSNYRRQVEIYDERDRQQRESIVKSMQVVCEGMKPALSQVFPQRQQPQPWNRKAKSSSEMELAGMKKRMERTARPAKELCLHPNYVPLPLIDDLSYDPTQPFGRVRQSSQIWLEARKLVHFTASSIGDALGFYEEQSADFLGRDLVAKRRISHTPLLKSWRMARNPSRESQDSTDIAQLVYFAWGKAHETNALLGLISQLPHIAEHAVDVATGMTRSNGQGLLLDPPAGLKPAKWKIHEVGSFILSVSDKKTCGNAQPRVSASPDGILSFENEPIALVEAKSRCAYRRDDKAEQDPCPWFPVRTAPHERMDISHFSQLQIQMACTGLSSGFLVSHALEGKDRDVLRVFHVLRNDRWIQSALWCLQSFYSRYVQTGLPPGPNVYQRLPETKGPYEELLIETKASTSSAKIIYESSGF